MVDWTHSGPPLGGPGVAVVSVLLRGSFAACLFFFLGGRAIHYTYMDITACLLSSTPGAALFPGELTSSLPLSGGGVGLVHVPTQVQALQAKVISRLLEPERLAWKVFQLYHVSQASQVQPLGYGASILFSTLSIQQLETPFN